MPRLNVAKRRRSAAPEPHKLDLYRLAVQHPRAEAALLSRIYSHHRRGRTPWLFREDFCGGAALACAWVARHEHCRALAVDAHGLTVRWARRQAALTLGERAQDLICLHADVLAVASPRVDLIAALNFSAMIYHRREDLRAYFRHARRALMPGGLLVVDVYGGPGAWRVGTQTRRVDPARDVLHQAAPRPSAAAHARLNTTPAPFDYLWEQRGVDLLAGRVDCRIHFRLASGRVMRSAFRYDWRLWSLPELVELMREAGFARAVVWCDQPARPGHYAPQRSLPAREDFVAYVVGAT